MYSRTQKKKLHSEQELKKQHCNLNSKAPSSHRHVSAPHPPQSRFGPWVRSIRLFLQDCSLTRKIYLVCQGHFQFYSS
ncbi:hypothetical protein HPB47_015463 [Ixodes persulcatus]|uniref:Uncharacterized protein n=1 Tax=Ixodes persulcatus TaxID=34615 RepID=A0AC60QTE5_IXOPE|nr:hypothetical protein HPB47_015463 [Ixodes persulcatus]